MWEGISCNRTKFNYLQPKVVNIEQFKDQFSSFSACLLLLKLKKMFKKENDCFLKEWKQYYLKK